MLRISANDTNDTISLNNLAFITDGLNTCTNFHKVPQINKNTTKP